MTKARIVVACGLFACIGLKADAVDPPAKAETSLVPPLVRALAYSPDGKILVAGVGKRNEPGEVVAWDAESGKQLWVKRGPKGFSSVSFAPDGKSVAVAHGTTTAMCLDPNSGKELGEVGPHPTTVRACVHIPGTDWLATGSDGVIRLWDMKTGKVAKELKDGHPAEVFSLVVSPGGKWLISTGPDSTRGWDVTTGKELKDAVKQGPGIGWYGITFTNPDRFLFGSNSGAIRMMELPSGKELLKFKNDGGYAEIAFSPAVGLAAYRWTETMDAHIADLTFRDPTADEKARIEKLLKDFDDDSYAVRAAASKSMQELGSVAEPMLRKAMADGSSAEVRMRAGEARKAILEQPLRALKGHTGPIGPMTFAPNGKVLATGANDGTVRLWDPQTGKELAKLEVPDPTSPNRP
jgi:WD40 repeat protein